MHPIELTEKRIDNAMQAMNTCEEGTWSHNYWKNVVGYLLRKLNGEIHNETDNGKRTYGTRQRRN
jgi:hypothetical protein